MNITLDTTIRDLCMRMNGEVDPADANDASVLTMLAGELAAAQVTADCSGKVNAETEAMGRAALVMLARAVKLRAAAKEGA